MELRLDKVKGEIGVSSLTWPVIFVLIYGGLVLIPNGIDSRIQRPANLEIAALFAAGGFIAYRIQFWIGILVVQIATSFIVTFYAPIFILNLLLVYCFFYIAVSFGNIDKDKIYTVISVMILLNILWQILQYFGIYILQIPKELPQDFLVIGKRGMGNYAGLMANINETSALYALGFTTFFRKKWIYCIPIVLLGIFMARSMNGALAVFIVSGIYVIIRFKKKSVPIIVAMVIGLSIFGKYERFNIKSHIETRGIYWQKVISIANLKPLGWGLGQHKYVMPLLTSFKYLKEDDRKFLYNNIVDHKTLEKALRVISNNNPKYFTEGNQYDPLWRQAHCELIECWFDLGIFGLFFLIVAIGSFLWRSFNKKDRIPFYGLVASVVTACVFFSWQLVPIALLTIFYMGTTYEYKRIL